MENLRTVNMIIGQKFEGFRLRGDNNLDGWTVWNVIFHSLEIIIGQDKLKIARDVRGSSIKSRIVWVEVLTKKKNVNHFINVISTEDSHCIKTENVYVVVLDWDVSFVLSTNCRYQLDEV